MSEIKQRRYKLLADFERVHKYLTDHLPHRSDKKDKTLGATYCFGGGREFYTCIGFETICNRELCKKEWKN